MVIAPARLLVEEVHTDRGWDDALCLVFDDSAHGASLAGTIFRQTQPSSTESGD